jgi:hypothetical protein
VFNFDRFSRKKQVKHIKVINWAEAFGNIDMKEMLEFAIDMANKISG